MDNYKRISIPKKLKNLIIAAGALRGKTLLAYVNYRLSPIVDAIATANDPSASAKAKAEAEGFLETLELGEVIPALGDSPAAILFNKSLYDKVVFAAQLEQIKPYKLLHRYLIPIARADLREAVTKVLPKSA